MADVSLDDLIKKDKEKFKQNKTAKVVLQSIQKPNKFEHKNKGPRQNVQQEDRSNSRPPKAQGEGKPFKKKFIKKEFPGNKKFERRNNEFERQDKFKGNKSRE